MSALTTERSASAEASMSFADFSIMFGIFEDLR
jgi:hypothetical protein